MSYITDLIETNRLENGKGSRENAKCDRCYLLGREFAKIKEVASTLYDRVKVLEAENERLKNEERRRQTASGLREVV